MAFKLSENTAREIETAFQAFKASENRLASSFADDMENVHKPAAIAYCFLRAEAEAAGVSLSSPTLWAETSFAGKDYKDYRAFMAALYEHGKAILELISERKITSWLSALQTWKKVNREAKEKVEKTWEDALLDLMAKYDVTAVELAEYLIELNEQSDAPVSKSSALDVAPAHSIETSKIKTGDKAKAKAKAA
jgi:hypothetical protein